MSLSVRPSCRWPVASKADKDSACRLKIESLGLDPRAPHAREDASLPMSDRDALVFDHDVATKLVVALYQALLAREADPSGLMDKADRLCRGVATPGELADEIVRSAEFATRLPSLAAMAAIHGHGRLTNDHSQYGEFGLLMRLWVNQNAKCGIVVDAGARGRDRSNSFDLMRHFGWRGLLIEANLALLPAIERDFAGLDLTLVSCAVSDYTGRATFTIGVNDDVSSLNSELAANWGELKGDAEVDVRRLGEILIEHAIPHEFDVLSLDIEGEDVRVLNDLIDNTSYRPSWIVIEASNDFQVRTLEDGAFSPAVRQTYEVVAATPANLILGRRHTQLADWHVRRL